MLRILRNILLLEVLAAIALVGIVAAMFLNRLAYYQEAAEKANMELVISSMKSALRMRMATMMIEGHMAQYGKLADDDPMDWLEQKPDNYSSEILPAAPPEMRMGRWAFDKSSRILSYWPEHTDHLQPDSEGQHRIRLRVLPLTEKTGAPNERAQLTTGVRIVLVEPYKWF